MNTHPPGTVPDMATVVAVVSENPSMDACSWHFVLSIILVPDGSSEHIPLDINLYTVEDLHTVTNKKYNQIINTCNVG
jgi:hypothetical protein